MLIHLIYATFSSGTLSAAEYIKDLCIDLGHTCKIIAVKDVQEKDLKEPDLLIFGSPSWERDHFKHNGQPHYDFFPMFKKYEYDADAVQKTSTLDLQSKPCTVFGLGDKKYPVFCGAVDIMADFLTVSHARIVSELLRIDGYYFHTPAAQESLHKWLEQALISAK